MITHYYAAHDASGALCGSTGGDSHTDPGKVTCKRCLELLVERGQAPSAADAIKEVAELADKPPTDDTARGGDKP